MSTMPGARTRPPASTRSAAAPRSRPPGSPLIAAMRPSLTARLPTRAGVLRRSMIRAWSITRSWGTVGARLSAIGRAARGAAGAAPDPPAPEHVLDVEEAERGRRAVGGAAVGAGDVGVDGGDARAHLGLGGQGPQHLDGAVDPRPDLEREGQHRELLALEELLDPPQRIVGRVDAGNAPAAALEPLELPLALGLLDLLLDPGVPALPGRLALAHRLSAASPADRPAARRRRVSIEAVPARPAGS